MFVAHVVEHHPNGDWDENQKTEGAEEFFAELVRHLPQLAALEKARKDPSSDVTTGSLRDIQGGDIALRGIGMAIFARAFLCCVTEDVDFALMAAKLGTLDWNLLDCERSELPAGPTYATEVAKRSHPMWAHLLVIGESRYRISSSSVDADAAWEKICDKVFDGLHAAA